MKAIIEQLGHIKLVTVNQEYFQTLEYRRFVNAVCSSHMLQTTRLSVENIMNINYSVQ